jgi:hypothetical protein
MFLAYKHTFEFPNNDANFFYEKALNAKSWFSIFGVGSTFMAFLIYPLVKSGTSLFILFLFFSTVSYQTFLMFFDQMAKNTTKGLTICGIAITQFFFLLPSFHYWSGFIGKDVLIFFFMTYLLFEFKKKAKVNFSHIIVMVLFLLLRPHIFLATFIAFLVYYFTQKDLTKILKIQLALLSLIIIGVSIPIIKYFANLKKLSLNSVLDKWNEISSYASLGGSGIDLSGSSYFERIWLLLFRPLFYDAKTWYQYYISVENCIVLLFVLLVCVSLVKMKKLILINGEVKLALLVATSILLLIAVYIYNLGLASRMRLMILPLIFYAFHQLIHFDQTKKV